MLWFLLTTGQCNLRCRYCGGSFDPRHSPWGIQYDLEDLKRLLSQDAEPVVFFYGGEPLLNPQFIMGVMDSISAARWGIQTNGTLAKRLPPEYWRKFDVVLLSIDGIKEVTDYYRGPGVYDAVVKALRWLREIGCKCQIIARMAVSKLSDIYRDVVHLLSLGFDKVHWQLNAVWTDEWSPREFLLWAEESYLPGLARLRDLFIERARQGQLLGIVPFLGIYRALLLRPFTWVPCGAGRDAFAVNTDGRILACPIAVSEKWAVIGHVKRGPGKLDLRLNPKCATCEYKHICGGRCLYTHYEKYWGEEGFDAVCLVTKRTIEILKERKGDLEVLLNKGIISEKDLNYEPTLDSTEVIP
ncbi:TIGR04084 family radical SAM/SPASM domain-containing protein [Thermoproteus tenax]|uniref:Radical SAM superfamily enzyme n=1 Tax=Thermoproteus tenax (strain ATCC 35583 / DSM 2078 / JCM 9277 / NBRC 100435 / Kra 1) TaxID=768679 RepID=G4RQ51_THETK|nr:TIGR04084 family radical SAM/SPASM domain-containing protein [Thermoproteus tenax]CCC80688.1 Radical SAM superfamily enzyme [Thermoproteus tenax Kra 1]